MNDRLMLQEDADRYLEKARNESARESLMAKLDRNGVAIHYEVHGSGPTILLSHGYSSTSRMWDGQVAALKDRYQVVVWDFRGHGESDYPKDRRNIPRR